MGLHHFTYLILFTILPCIFCKAQDNVEEMKTSYLKGIEYFEQDKFHNALQYFEKSYSLYRAFPDSLKSPLPWQIPFYIHIKYGECLFNMGFYFKSEYYFLKSILIFKENNPGNDSADLLCYAYNDLSLSYDRQSKTIWRQLFTENLLKCEDPFYRAVYYLARVKYAIGRKDYTQARNNLDSLTLLIKQFSSGMDKWVIRSQYEIYNLQIADALLLPSQSIQAFRSLDRFFRNAPDKPAPKEYIHLISTLIDYAISHNLNYEEYSTANTELDQWYNRNSSYIELIISQNKYKILIAKNRLDDAVNLIYKIIDKDRNNILDINDWHKIDQKELFIEIYEDLIGIEYKRVQADIKPKPLDSVLQLIDMYFNLCDLYMQNTHNSISRLNYLNYSEKTFSQIKEIIDYYYRRKPENISLSTVWRYHEKLRGYVYTFLLGVQYAMEHNKLTHDEKKRLMALKKDISIYQNKMYHTRDKELKAFYRLKLTYSIQSIDSLLQTTSHKKYKKDDANLLSNLFKYNRQHDVTTVQYSISDHMLFTFILSGNDIVLHRTEIPKDSLVSILSRYKKHLIFNDYILLDKQELREKIKKFHKISYQLYKILLAPYEDHLNFRVRIIPDPLLVGIPFETLCTREHIPELSFVSLKYSIYNHAFHYLTVKPFKSGHDYSGASKNMLCIIPDYKNSPVNNYLGSTQYEYRYFSDNTDATIWTGKKASPQYIMSHWRDYSMINFTGHASSQRKSIFSPFLSTNLDSSGRTNIFTEDIKYENLNAKLIFLNACETQAGVQHFTEGLLGLHKAFYLANAQSIISTMWSISDKASSRIIIETYKNLNDGLPLDKALRLAKLNILRENNPILSAPFFWAAHSLNGKILTSSELIGTGSFPMRGVAIILICLSILFLGYYLLKRKHNKST